jgi:hypothetical protein
VGPKSQNLLMFRAGPLSEVGVDKWIKNYESAHIHQMLRNQGHDGSKIPDDRLKVLLKEILASHFRSGGSGEETNVPKKPRTGTRGGGQSLFNFIKDKVEANNTLDNEKGQQAIRNWVEEYKRIREEKNLWWCLLQ